MSAAAAAYPLETQHKLHRPSEAQIQDAVLEYLELHPRVAACWRQNNGAMTMEYHGQKRLIRFARSAGGQPVTVLDITGYLTDGRRLEVEVKRRLPKPETIEKWATMLDSDLSNEAKIFIRQRAVIAHAREHGCVAGFVCSVDDMARLMGRAIGV